MGELLTINYVQNEATKQNEEIINLKPKNIYIINQKLNSNWREGNNPRLRDVRMMGIGNLRKNNTQLRKHKQKKSYIPSKLATLA